MMRFEGTIKAWNEAKGFGFLVPRQGAQDIFLHVSALPRGMAVPRIGQAFSFEIELSKDGKKRAVRVQHVGAAALPQRVEVSSRHRKRPAIAILSMVAALAFAAVMRDQGAGINAVTSLWKDAAEATHQEPPVTAPTTSLPFSCDGRTRCPQMTSCAEAKFFLSTCPGVEMDGDGDGTPCEQQWCPGP